MFATMIVPGPGYRGNGGCACYRRLVWDSASPYSFCIWSEVFGCLSPLRVTLYYTASIALGAVVLYVFMRARACRGSLVPHSRCYRRYRSCLHDAA